MSHINLDQELRHALTNVKPQPVIGSVTVGRLSSRPPRQRHVKVEAPRRQGAPAPSFSSALRMVVDGLQARLSAGGNGSEQLARGSSLFGCVLKKGGKKVESVEGLRELIYSLSQLRNVKEYNRGGKILLFFNVPKGYQAFTGEVDLNKYLGKFELRDKELKKAWEARLAAGYTLKDGERAPYTEEALHPKLKDTWGPLSTRAIAGLKVVPFRTTTLVDGALQPGYDFRIFTDKEVMHPAISICFVVDKTTGQLVTWQPGRYAEEGEGKHSRVIISSEEMAE